MNENRARIRLMSGADALALVDSLRAYDDSFFIESRTGARRVNAKSLLGVICSMLDFLEEMYLVNETHAGVIPSCVDQFRFVGA